MIDRDHELPLVRQAALLRLSRSRLYYEPRPVPAAELAIMRRIDVLHLDYPFAGRRMLRDLLAWRGRRDRPRSGADDDAAHVHRGAVSPPQHVQARTPETRGAEERANPYAQRPAVHAFRRHGSQRMWMAALRPP